MNNNLYAVTVEINARDERAAIELVRDPTGGEFEPLGGGNARAVLVDIPPADRERVERVIEALGPLTHPNADKWPSIERDHAVEIVLAVLMRMRGESNEPWPTG